MEQGVHGATRRSKVYRCLCTSLGWFKHLEPSRTTSLSNWCGSSTSNLRTFSNHIIAKIPRCVQFSCMSSGWFDCTEPSLPGETRCTGCLCTVWCGSTVPNLLYQEKQGVQVLQEHRTSSNHINSKVCT